MNDRNKHKVTGQMNHQTADPKANASVFLFFPTTHFLKTNAEHSRAPLKDKLNKQVILASRTNEVHEHQKTKINPFVNGTFGFARHTSRPFSKCEAFANTAENQTLGEQNQKSRFFANALTKSRILTDRI